MPLRWLYAKAWWKFSSGKAKPTWEMASVSVVMLLRNFILKSVYEPSRVIDRVSATQTARLSCTPQGIRPAFPHALNKLLFAKTTLILLRYPKNTETKFKCVRYWIKIPGILFGTHSKERAIEFHYVFRNFRNSISNQIILNYKSSSVDPWILSVDRRNRKECTQNIEILFNLLKMNKFLAEVAQEVVKLFCKNALSFL